MALSPRMEAFLAVYAECGSVSKAAELTKIHRTAHYKALETIPEYQDRFQEARRQWAANLGKVKERLQGLVGPALELIEGHLQALLNPKSKRRDLVLDKVDYLFVKDALDRAGFKPKIEVEHSGQVNLIVERLQAARKRVQPA